MAGEMITSLKALLSPQMAKYVGSSCSQQLGGHRGRREAEGGWQPGSGPQGPGLPAPASPEALTLPLPRPGTLMPNGPKPQSLHSLLPARGLGKARLTSLLSLGQRVQAPPSERARSGRSLCTAGPLISPSPAPPLLTTAAH